MSKRPGFWPRIDLNTIRACVEAKSNEPYWESRREVPLWGDLRDPEQFLKMGADPNNNPVSEGAKHRPISTIGAFVSSAGNALKITNAEAVRYPEKHERAKKTVRTVLELLIKYEADFNDWFDNEESFLINNRSFFLGDPPEDKKDFYGYKATEDIRAILKEYFGDQ